eukprot:TRINITY_DN15995_c0_g1_i3.p1 TRINITY_DN15995_c0_g1~~TRINITY_DN15995_c0_g1_i3.p1  ORF type:complete len:444 (-),score=89.66 TRINITY_DN15995_c0_g1_i3:69-1400(-)
MPGSPSTGEILHARALLGIHPALFVAVVCLFLGSRHVFPIKQRKPYLVVLSLIFLEITALVLILAMAFPDNVTFSNCRPAMYIVVASFFCFGAVSYSRFTWLIWKSISTKDLVNRFSAPQAAQAPLDQSSDHRKISWLAAHWIIKFAGFILQYISVDVLPWISPCVVSLLSIWWWMQLKDASNSKFWELTCIDTMNALRSSIWMCTLLGIASSSMSVVLRVKDNFGIELESRILVIAWIVAFVSWFLATLLNVEETIIERISIYFIVYFASCLTLFWGAHPWWIARKYQIAERNSERHPSYLKNSDLNLSLTGPLKAISNHEQLMTLIASTEGRKLFLSFLELEFSVENLYFVEACDALRQLDMGSENFLKHIELIQTTFVDPSAVSSVNLAYNSRARLLNEMNQVKHSGAFDFSVLEEARREIFELMVKDTFTRFKFAQSKR